MANNIFERYGIKEVANVYFEALKDNDTMGYKAGDIVLYLDTLKVSTIETTAENVSAQGGWGNPKLVTWDYGKDINVTLEDAVISWEEMSILLGAEKRNGSSTDPVHIRKTAEHPYPFNVESFVWPNTNAEIDEGGTDEYGKHLFPSASVMSDSQYVGAGTLRFLDLTNGKRGTFSVDATGAITFKTSDGKAYTPAPIADSNEDIRIRFFWEDIASAEADAAVELIISPSRFPDTYRVIGDALIRSEKNNMDEAFQFVINKAKLLSEVTLTMQAEGDPSTFNMTLNVLRDPSGNMMKLIKY